MTSSSPPTRRRFLARFGVIVGAASVAGCVDGDSTGESGNDAEQGESDAPSDDGDDDSDSGEEDATDADGDATDADDSDPAECDPDDLHAEYDEVVVRATTPDGDELGSVTAAIADTGDLQILGLSDTDCLPEDRGLLFVYGEVAPRTFVMRDMEFPIDIVYADDEGVITSIHHAEAPDPGESGEEAHHQYSGEGQYVFEVVYEWTTDRGVEEGDVLAFEL